MSKVRGLLQTLVGFDTTSRNSNLQLVDWMVDRLGGLGARVRLTFNDEASKGNVLASFGPPDTQGIVFSGHTDVVPVDGQQWTSDPFALREDAGRLYGRGTADMKGFVACCLAAAEQYAARALQRPIHLAFSYDEEVGCLGVPRLIEDLLAAERKPAFAIVGEPTGMRIGDRHRGFLGYETQFYGQAAHSSDPDAGHNAIYDAAAFASFIEAQNAAWRRGPEPDATFSVGLIDGGTAINIVPSNCRVVWEFRPTGEAVIQDVHAAVETFLARQAPIRSPMTTLVARVPPLQSNPEAISLAAALGGELPPHDLPFGTEGGFFDEVGIATLVCGPGSIAQAHQPDEWIAVQQLNQCERFLGRIGDWAEGLVGR